MQSLAVQVQGLGLLGHGAHHVLRRLVAGVRVVAGVAAVVVRPSTCECASVGLAQQPQRLPVLLGPPPHDVLSRAIASEGLHVSVLASAAAPRAGRAAAAGGGDGGVPVAAVGQLLQLGAVAPQPCEVDARRFHERPLQEVPKRGQLARVVAVAVGGQPHVRAELPAHAFAGVHAVFAGGARARRAVVVRRGVNRRGIARRGVEDALCLAEQAVEVVKQHAHFCRARVAERFQGAVGRHGVGVRRVDHVVQLALQRLHGPPLSRGLVAQPLLVAQPRRLAALRIIGISLGSPGFQLVPAAQVFRGVGRGAALAALGGEGAGDGRRVVEAGAEHAARV